MSGHSSALVTVYLVDDDLATAYMYRLGLREAGFNPVVVPDASALFEALDHEIPDVLVLDWTLEGITGGDVLRVLRADPRTAQLPVLFLSNHPPANSYVEDQVAGGGAIAWLIKIKTSPDQLAQRVRDAYKRSAQQAS